jgi:hypothetical protein
MVEALGINRATVTGIKVWQATLMYNYENMLLVHNVIIYYTDIDKQCIMGIIDDRVLFRYDDNTVYR